MMLFPSPLSKHAGVPCDGSSPAWPEANDQPPAPRVLQSAIVAENTLPQSTKPRIAVREAF
jgi:hypothetical protein